LIFYFDLLKFDVTSGGVTHGLCSFSYRLVLDALKGLVLIWWSLRVEIILIAITRMMLDRLIIHFEGLVAVSPIKFVFLLVWWCQAIWRCVKVCIDLVELPFCWRGRIRL